MSAARLLGFAYGEHVESGNGRSLGSRLLAPSPPAPWCAEIESLARGLQAASYPSSWPPRDMFCSVILQGGERLVALARYGLTDRTPGQRPGRLELIGVVGPSSMSPLIARAIYEWLKLQRQALTDLATFGSSFDLDEVLAAAPAPPTTVVASPLPVQLAAESSLLFTATSPSDPDLQLGLIDHLGRDNWQWLPLVGPDVSLATYARRGPLVAWTTQSAPIAVRVDPPPMAPVVVSPRSGFSWLTLLIGLALLAVTGVNLWLTFEQKRSPVVVPTPVAASETKPEPTVEQPADREDNSAEQLAIAMHRHLQQQGALKDVSPSRLLAQYDRLAARDEHFRATSVEGKMALGAVALLARRTPERVEAITRQALEGKGYDPELIAIISKRIQQQLAESSD